MSEQEHVLIDDIRGKLNTGKHSTAKLATDDRIIARITDGIYRQPASALRELIANAYDADAANVYIQTDSPQFGTISVRDDGNGLTIESLANLIYHIGGSPKRTPHGADLGVVNRQDPTLSPKGRRLIGKIGIGLFSVAQLTRKFQIMTKVKGTDYRLVAEVILKTYTEDRLSRPSPEDIKKPLRVETGEVRIRSVRAPDKNAHGTEIVLMDLRPQTKSLLQSRDVWLHLEVATDAEGMPDTVVAPTYHIARVEGTEGSTIQAPARLPWTNIDPPDTRFAKLFQAVVDEVGSSTSNPKLETVLDNYLRMLWTLSLSAPVDYIDRHPFDLTGADKLNVFKLANEAKGQATRLRLKQDDTIRSAMNLKAPERGTQTPFSVFVDDIQLKRPIRFKDLPRTQQVITEPMMFIGKAEPDLSRISDDERGGDLSFEAYLFWTPKVVPKEHNGLLVRISDASGTLFDETFMKYQIAELTRLRQITAEIFVKTGLDAALNIDRESFNYAHPHYQYVMKWAHRALRQLTNTLKQVSSDLRKERTQEQAKGRAKKLDNTVKTKLRRVQKEEEAPRVVFTDDDSSLKKERKDGALAFNSTVVFADVPEAERRTPGKKSKREHFEAQIAAVAQILEAYGVFEGMRYERQQELLQAIAAIFAEGDEK